MQIPWRAVRSDTDGEYILEYLPAGRLDLEVTGPAGGIPAHYDVQVGKDSRVLEKNLRLGGGCSQDSRNPPPF